MNDANQAQPVRDRLGRIFDALKFRRGPDGQPRFDVLGRFVNLRGGRKKKLPTMETPSPSQPAASSHAENGASGSVTPAATPETTREASPAVPPPPPDFADVKKALGSFDPGAEPADVAGQAAALAEEISDLPDNPTAESIIGIIQTGLVLIGEEEGILTMQEKILLRRPLERVLKKYEIGSNTLPAEVDLALCLLGLVAARLQKPKTATFALKCKAWIMQKFFASKGEKLAAKLEREVGGAVNPANAK